LMSSRVFTVLGIAVCCTVLIFHSAFSSECVFVGLAIRRIVERIYSPVRQNWLRAREEAESLRNERGWMKFRTALSSVRFKAHWLFEAVLGRILVYTRMIVFLTDTQRVHFSEKKGVGFSARLARSEDILRLHGFSGFRRGEAEKRLRAGELCFVAEKDGELVNYAWVCFHEAYVDELEIGIKLNPGSVYRHDVFTVRACRGMGIFPLVFEESCRYLSQKGIRELYGIVDSSNACMLRVYQKAGDASRRIGEVAYIRLFSLRRYRFDSDTVDGRRRLLSMFSG
jgi:GNAT superfamily N-acetyltransferase